MKKIILLTGAILMMSVTANACGGITVKGKSGTTYCLSKHDMNWYSAYAWCKDQGMKLIDTASVCNNKTGCSELALSSAEQSNITNNGGVVGWVWTNTSLDTANAYRIKLNSGATNTTSRTIVYSYSYALCF